VSGDKEVKACCEPAQQVIRLDVVITASRWEMVERKQGQKAVIKEHEFGLITDGPLFYFKFKLKMACKSIVYQKYNRSRFSKLKRLVIGGWRTQKIC